MVDHKKGCITGTDMVTQLVESKDLSVRTCALCGQLPHKMSCSRGSKEFDLSNALTAARKEKCSNVWRVDRPPDRVLVASSGSACVVLDHIGPAISYWEDACGISHDEFGSLPAGILILEVDVREWCYETLDGFEHDAELEVLSVRSATDEEVRAHADGEFSWDESQWRNDRSDDC